MVKTFPSFFGILLVSGVLGCSAGQGGGGTGEGGQPATGGSVGTGGNGSGGIVGTGGAGAVGGRGGSGPGTGGILGSGGTSPGSGGTGARGGSSGSGGTIGTGGAAGAGPSGNCTVTVASSALSPKISTVGIVTFTTTATSPTEAHIDFGLDTSYGMTAPVDLKASSYRTLLLGMKASKTYHYQISVTGKEGTCTSGDTTLATGALPNGKLPQLTVTTKNAAALYGGFLVTGQFVMGGGTTSGSPAFILDKDGDYVWWYTVPNSDVTGVAMSYDGNYLWTNSVNVPQGTAHVHRISMDGMTDDDDSSQFTGLSHQLTVLPDETVAFYAYGTNGCEDIKLRSPSGTVTTVVNAKTAHGGSGGCHVNGIHYDKSDDSLIFSDLDNNCLTKVTRSGQTVWILNGGVGGITSTFSNGTLLWKGGEHGFHILAANDILLFNNNSTVNFGGGSWGSAAGDGSGSIALELKLDTTAKTASSVWSYKANPGIDNQILGDVQRLPNGNTVVDYATKDTIQEVDSKGNLLQTITSNYSFGYIQKRATLYGPPPR
jgi:Arylsulfotransferase (ASST)